MRDVHHINDAGTRDYGRHEGGGTWMRQSRGMLMRHEGQNEAWGSTRDEGARRTRRRRVATAYRPPPPPQDGVERFFPLAVVAGRADVGLAA